MRTSSQILAFFLLALWLPATLHCDLEAAGLIAMHSDHGADIACDGSHARCPSENCRVIEDGGYKPSYALVKAR